MTTMSIDEVGNRLFELIHRLNPGEELIITENSQPVAKLVGQAAPARLARQPGSAKGKLVINVEDDEHLDDFTEYMS